ncbi:family 16 glycoside hydrolase [Rosistilla oblonga]|uniref:family 16 glycoside hydrolase n=1 Tax=Rosistilla oblonga TaxID=2527990 RepID=UPI003A97B18F
MRIALCSLLTALICSVAWSQPTTYATPEAAAEDPDFAIQGEYVGPKRAMQVIALGDGEFEAVIFGAGLPGDGWDKTPPQRVPLDADAVLDLVDANQMQRVDRKSPTLGQQPPPGAIVMFDGTTETLDAHWQSGRMTDDGLLIEGVTSKDRFDDFRLHLEFRTPFMPAARGQARGNSGVYYQGRYETQILDSFGLAGAMNETGGIYTIRDPDLNMCFPPLAWQTYDADFTAARYDGDGKKTADAKLTVRLNGVIVQQNVALPHKTRAAPNDEGPQPGPLYLQNHGNPVRFRNIWVQPRDADKEARRPRIPGFERFAATGDAATALGGHLLISELGCATCHAQSKPTVAAKQAPILDSVGSRIRPDHLLAFIGDPHGEKPGTTMPDLLAGLDPQQRDATVRALASYLGSTGIVVDRVGDPVAARRGKELFHMIGCTACHAPQDGTVVSDATTIPLGKLDQKYTFDSLVGFLKHPHATRPSGRMPSFGFQDGEAEDLATYLLRDVILGEAAVNTKATFYEGSWKTLPDFETLTPEKEVETFGLDIQASGRKDRFAARFDSYFIAPKRAKYKFHLGSDDGSRVLVDGKQVVIYDGIHPHGTRTAEVLLEQGVHELRVEYFEFAGEESLSLEIEGGGLNRTMIDSILSLDPSGQMAEPLFKSTFQPDPALIEQGRSLFTSIGCASCHQMKSLPADATKSLVGPAMKTLDTSAGCLAETPAAGLPNFDLNVAQRQAIGRAIDELRTGPPKVDAAGLVHQTMATMNCYACHSRDKIGGPEATRDAVFKTTMQEMGDEGRLPPPLTGVGDKLKSDYITQILNKGADERPYMLANMPGFGTHNMPGFVDALVALDQKSEADIAAIDQPRDEQLSAGRMLAGNKGLSCVKCHTFGGQGAPGIGAIDMQRMTSRLREDWFHRYLMSPQTYRPGTRMPASFPDGKSVVPDLYDGHPSAQIGALWTYLADGAKARPPIGVEKELIELIPEQRPIIYRNFIEGLTPRGIAVGYPQRIHIAWDAGTMSLALAWKGAFIDASKHWVGRGPGNQEPLGDAIRSLEKVAPLARLDAIDAPWPTEDLRAQGYRFLGYRLDPSGQPTFRYRAGEVTVEDTPLPQVDDSGAVSLRRQLQLTGPADTAGLTLRLAAGKNIEAAADGWYRIDGNYSIRIDGPTQLVSVGDGQELRMPVSLENGTATIEEQIRW